MFSDAPRKPPRTGTASPASRPIPTGNANSALGGGWEKLRCNATAARIACLADANTASASSPRSSNTTPSWASTICSVAVAN